MTENQKNVEPLGEAEKHEVPAGDSVVALAITKEEGGRIGLMNLMESLGWPCITNTTVELTNGDLMLLVRLRSHDLLEMLLEDGLIPIGQGLDLRGPHVVSWLKTLPERPWWMDRELTRQMVPLMSRNWEDFIIVQAGLKRWLAERAA